MNDIMNTLNNPVVLIAIGALIIIIMMLLAIMTRISRRDAEHRREYDRLSRRMDDRLDELGQSTEQELRAQRESLNRKVEQLNDGLASTLTASERRQFGRLDELGSNVTKAALRQGEQYGASADALNQRLSDMAQAIDQRSGELDARLDRLSADMAANAERAIDQRLGAAFGELNARLSGILDEMQLIRTGLSAPAPSRYELPKGFSGDILDAILGRLLPQGGYIRKFEIGTGSGCYADYAVPLPDESGENLYLPIDSGVDFAAYGDDSDDRNRRMFRQAMTERATYISKNLIKPGLTTDFALLFTPDDIGGADGAQNDIFDSLQREYRVIVVGPAALGAMLSALERGISAYAVQRHSLEVETLLRDVRDQLSSFSNLLSDGGAADAAAKPDVVPEADSITPTDADAGTDETAANPVGETAADTVSELTTEINQLKAEIEETEDIWE